MTIDFIRAVFPGGSFFGSSAASITTQLQPLDLFLAMKDQIGGLNYYRPPLCPGIGCKFGNGKLLAQPYLPCQRVKLHRLICLYKQEALRTGLLPQIRMISQRCEGIVGMVIGKEQEALQLDKTHTKADVMCKLDCFPPSSTLFANLYWMFKRVFWGLKYLLHGQIYIFQVRSDKLEARRALRATSFRYPPYPLPPYLPSTYYHLPEPKAPTPVAWHPL